MIYKTLHINQQTEKQRTGKWQWSTKHYTEINRLRNTNRKMTMIYKTLHRNQQTEKHEPTKNSGWMDMLQNNKHFCHVALSTLITHNTTLVNLNIFYSIIWHVNTIQYVIYDKDSEASLYKSVTLQIDDNMKTSSLRLGSIWGSRDGNQAIMEMPMY
jgi:hypothetical protein